MTGRTLFKNCKLLDGENPAITTATIALDGDCIVGAEAEVPQALPGDTVIDLRGLTIMPGMVMSHFHAAYRENGGPHSMSVNASPASPSFTAISNAQIALRRGFTSVVSVSTFYNIDAALSKEIERGFI